MGGAGLVMRFFLDAEFRAGWLLHKYLDSLTVLCKVPSSERLPWL